MSGGRSMVIIGAGGHGRVVADIAICQGYLDISFVDERWPELTSNLGWKVVGANVSEVPKGCDVFIAIGNNRKRFEQYLWLTKEGRALPNLVHPRATVSKFSNMGRCNVAMPHSVVNAGATLGSAVIINTGATVDHDCHIADGVHVSPGAHLAGGVQVGEGSWIGIGACVREGICIGRNVFVGAGATVVKDIPDGLKVVGIPAKPSH